MIHETDRRRVCEVEHGWSVANRLVATEPQPLRQARATVALAGRLHRFDKVEHAVCAGIVSVAQADAITRCLAELPAELPAEGEAEAQDAMIVQARAGFDPAGLRRVGNRLVEVVDPDAADDGLGAQLERQERRARRDRFSSWATAGDGASDVRARSPIVEGEAFVAVIEAESAGLKGADQGLDPVSELPTTAQRRSDALCRLVADHQHAVLAPDQTGDRPRVAVMLDYQDLIEGVRGATLLGPVNRSARPRPAGWPATRRQRGARPITSNPGGRGGRDRCG